MAARMHPDAGTPVAGAKAGEIMTSPVITVPPDSPVGDVADVLVSHRISAVPVVDAAGSVVGLVSEYDLLAKPGGIASEVMTTAVISVTESTDVADVRHLLVDRRIRRVPVLNGGRLVGIVSRGDIVAVMATEWVCEVCGEAVRGDRPPQTCPRCHGGGERFALQQQPPGT
ncbi:MAG: CBS domain-containing protein [Actinomycetes bacterium]